MKWIRSHRSIILLCAVIIRFILNIIANMRYGSIATTNSSTLFLNNALGLIVLPALLFFFIRNDDYRKRENRIVLAAVYLGLELVVVCLSLLTTLVLKSSYGKYFAYQVLNSIAAPIIESVLLLVFALRKTDSGDKWFILVCIITFGIAIVSVVMIKDISPVFVCVIGILTFNIAFLNSEAKEQKKNIEYSYLEEYKRNLK